jgi:hypothetical protein
MSFDAQSGKSAEPVASLVWNGSAWVEMVQGETKPASATVTAVASTTSSVTLIAENTNRRGLSIFNDSTAVLYVKHGSSAATASDYTVKLVAGAFYELPHPIYTGALTGRWAAANGYAMVTENT